MTAEEKATERLNQQLKDLIDSVEEEQQKSSRRKLKRWTITLFSSFFFIYLLSLNERLSYNIYFVFLSLVRLILIQILPFWNWTSIYTNTCFLGNPFYNHSLDLSECYKCESTSAILRQSNMSFFNFTKNIYLHHQPVIIDDATKDWPAMRDLTMAGLFQLFTEDSVLAEQDLCYFEVNIRTYNRAGGADRLFNDYLAGKRRSFTAHWNNCKRESLKVLRSYYQKPYFLPPSVSQTMMGNWFFVSAGFEKSKNALIKIPLNYNWIWLAQIQGSTLIHLRPKHPCEQLCSDLKSLRLNPGDLIIYSNIYDASYTPLKRETILLAQGVD